MDVPQTEADIAFTGLKVDDLVNSIRAKTKIVFLDACRDNPALFANLVKGRGSYPKGLAPAVGSNFEETASGGGVFIAYATDSGSVALDGQAEHSPFTQALLRNLDKPISIDDMFSLVTREVRLVTKNAQRPYKYASLENIVCLTGSCSSSSPVVDTDIVQEAQRSESEDLQIALQTNSSDALETYLQKYPESDKRNDVLNAIAARKRSEFDGWTLYEVVPPSFQPT
jgi:caspase domain-containing protein